MLIYAVGKDNLKIVSQKLIFEKRESTFFFELHDKFLNQKINLFLKNEIVFICEKSFL